MLNPDYRDILSIFNETEVNYLIVGAYALAAHGHPRATGDIDLWIEASPENSMRVMEALRQFGAPVAGVSPEDFQTPEVVFQIGVTPRRIDILTTIDGVRFREAWPERLEVELEGLLLPIINRKHLIQNKRATGRDQDRVDISLLEDGESEADPGDGRQ